MLNIIYRKKREGVNSIESVFAAIDKKLAIHKNTELPHEGGSPLILFKNILFAKKRAKEINHITGDAHYIVLGTGRRSLLTIHDVGSAFTSGWFKKLYVKLFWFWIPTLIAKRISVISDTTKNDVLKVCPWCKNKIRVIPNPYNTVFEGFEKELISNKTRILHIGTKKNKNLERTVKALKNLDCHLVIIGKLSDTQIELLNNDGIDFENAYDISLLQLVEEYRKCDIVSFPSSFEGFGMPIIEAQSAMRPVLAGDIPVLRDVAGKNGALFVNPMSIESIRSGFVKLIKDSSLRHALVINGKENIKRFHPSRIAAMYNEIYKTL